VAEQGSLSADDYVESMTSRIDEVPKSRFRALHAGKDKGG
jgi:hypothetical protein